MSFLFFLWRRFLRLCWESDVGGSSSSRTWWAHYRTLENNRSSASSTSSSAVVADAHRPDRAARRRNVSMRCRSADVEKAPPRWSSVGELRDDDWLENLLQKWYAHAVWTQDTDGIHGPRTRVDDVIHVLMTDSFSVTVKKLASQLYTLSGKSNCATFSMRLQWHDIFNLKYRYYFALILVVVL